MAPPIRKLVKPLPKAPVLQAPAKTLPKPGLAKAPLAATKAPIGIPASARVAPADDGFAKAREINQERKRQADLRANQPFEFYMKPGEGGEDGVILIITDMARMPAMPFFHYQHRWGFVKGQKGSGKNDECIKDGNEGCPLCKKLGREGTYEMVLTVLDGRKYTPQNGPNAGKTIPISKKLFIVKTTMIPKFERLYKEHKTFRGMCIKMFRDNDKDASIGSEVRFVKMIPEQVLQAKYKELAVPVDYSKAFPRPTYDELAARHGESMANETHVGGADFAGDTDADSLPF